MNFELQENYQNIHANGVKLVKNGSYFIDKDISNPEDLRRGITLLARPNATIYFKINEILQEISSFEIPLHCNQQKHCHSQEEQRKRHGVV